MEVKVSEAQGRGQPRGWVRKKRGAKARADEQKPDKKRERWTSRHSTAKSISIKGAERKSGGCALTAVELTSGGLRCCRPCPLWSDWRLGGCVKKTRKRHAVTRDEGRPFGAVL